MSNKISKLINSIQAGSSMKIKANFESIMSKKVVGKISEKREQVLSSMFTSKVPSGLTEAFSKYTPKQFEEFKGSKEYAAMDESEKSLLDKYLKEEKSK